MKIDVKGQIVSNNDAWVYDWLELEHSCAAKVNQSLQEAAGGPIDVYINSPGGNIFAASEIYAAIRDYSGPKRLHIVGLAASAASVIACAGPSDMAPTAMMMVHNVSTSGASGDYHDMEKEAKLLKEANKAIAAAYMDKSGMSQKAALDLMDKETWITAEKAVELGLVDEVSKPAANAEPLVANMGSGMLSASVIEKLKNLHDTPLLSQAKRKAQAELELLKLKGE